MPCRISTKGRRIREREGITATGREGRASLNESRAAAPPSELAQKNPGLLLTAPPLEIAGSVACGKQSLGTPAFLERPPLCLTVGFVQLPQNRRGDKVPKENVLPLKANTLQKKKIPLPPGKAGNASWWFSTSKFLFWYGSKGSSGA